MTSELRMAQLTENVQRADLTTLEVAEAVTAIPTASQSRAEIAEALGWSEAAISRFAAMVQMLDELREAAARNVTVRTLSDLHALWKEDAHAVRSYLADTESAEISRASVATLKARIAAIGSETAATGPGTMTTGAPAPSRRVDGSAPSQPDATGFGADGLKIENRPFPSTPLPLSGTASPDNSGWRSTFWIIRGNVATGHTLGWDEDECRIGYPPESTLLLEKMPTKKKPAMSYLTAELHARLSALADAQGQTVSSFLSHVFDVVLDGDERPVGARAAPIPVASRRQGDGSSSGRFPGSPG